MKWKALFFDIDDTIFDYTACSEQALRNTCQRLGVPFSQRILDVYRELDSVLWAQQKKGLLTVPQVQKKRAEGVTACAGIPDQADSFVSILRQELGNTNVCVEGIGEVLKYAYDAGYTLFCASNGTRLLQLRRLANADLLHYFTEVFVSNEVGYEKPDKRFFDHCLKQSGFQADEVLMIGDSLSADINGACEAGWQACYFDRSQTGSGGDYLVIQKPQELVSYI